MNYIQRVYTRNPTVPSAARKIFPKFVKFYNIFHDSVEKIK